VRLRTVSRISFDEYAMSLAETAALRSEDPYRQVGTCLMRPDRTVAGLGYNGAPPGVEIDWTDRDARRVWVVHAEINALRYARPGDVELVATTSVPCPACMVTIASYGIKRVLFRDELDPAVYDMSKILEIAEACGITVRKA
jgi:dCMP deaminase